MRGPSDIVQRVIRKWTAHDALNQRAAAQDWAQAGLEQLRAPEDMRALYSLSNGMAAMDHDLLYFSPTRSQPGAPVLLARSFTELCIDPNGSIAQRGLRTWRQGR